MVLGHASASPSGVTRYDSVGLRDQTIKQIVLSQLKALANRIGECLTHSDGLSFQRSFESRALSPELIL